MQKAEKYSEKLAVIQAPGIFKQIKVLLSFNW